MSHKRTYTEYFAKKKGYKSFEDLVQQTRMTFSEFFNEIEAEIKKQIFVEGRIWQRDGISFIAFWDVPNTSKTILKLIESLQNYGFSIDTSKTLIVLRNSISPLNYVVNHYDELKNNELVYDDEIKQIKNIHLMNQDEKQNALKDYRKTKSNMYGKIERDNNVNSIAQWRAMQNTSENKANKKRRID